MRQRPGLYRRHPPAGSAVREVHSAATKAEAIQAIYRAVEAPAWAAPNLDGLADVLRDLSWLPAGPVLLRWSEPSGPDAARVVEIVRRSAAESAGSPHPLTVYLVDHG